MQFKLISLGYLLVAITAAISDTPVVEVLQELTQDTTNNDIQKYSGLISQNEKESQSVPSESSTADQSTVCETYDCFVAVTQDMADFPLTPAKEIFSRFLMVIKQNK
ncbi:hypothetical protein N7490_006819 [Penicillium lividum]|nr:hypothetical protein N7490_006819 [Penicillium lividum]